MKKANWIFLITFLILELAAFIGGWLFSITVRLPRCDTTSSSVCVSGKEPLFFALYATIPALIISYVIWRIFNRRQPT